MKSVMDLTPLQVTTMAYSYLPQQIRTTWREHENVRYEHVIYGPEIKYGNISGENDKVTLP
jgi:hypothetical protein